MRASASVQLHAHAAIGGAAVGAVFGNRLVARVGDVIDAAVDRQAIPDRQFGADAGQRIAVDAHAAAVAVTVEAVADDLHGATDTQTEGQAIVDDERRGFLGPAQQIGAEGGAGRAVFRIDVRHVGRHGQRVDGAQADRERHAPSLIHISEPTRRRGISYAVFCLKKKKKKNCDCHWTPNT